MKLQSNFSALLFLLALVIGTTIALKCWVGIGATNDAAAFEEKECVVERSCLKADFDDGVVAKKCGGGCETIPAGKCYECYEDLCNAAPRLLLAGAQYAFMPFMAISLGIIVTLLLSDVGGAVSFISI